MSSAGAGLRARVGLLLLAALLAAGLVQARFSSWTDANLHEVFARWLPPRAAPPQIILVDIDERSIAELGPWPWPRALIADLVTRLRERGVRLQVWDLLLPEPAPGDDRLAAALVAGPAPDVLLGQVPVMDAEVRFPPRLGELRGAVRPPPLCSSHPPVIGHLGVSASLGAVAAGHIGALFEADGRLRRLPAVVCANGLHLPQLTLAAAQLLQPEADWRLAPGDFPFGPDRWLVRGGLRFALDAQGWMPVPYHRPHGVWPAVSASTLFDPELSAMPMKGAVVLVGGTALGMGDTVNTPFHPNAPGVSVHAELLGAAMGDGWRPLPSAPGLLAGLLAAAVGLLLLAFPQGRSRTAWLLFALGVSVLAPVLAAAVGRLGAVTLPVSAPVLALLAYALSLLLLQAAAERREAQRLTAHLQSFLPRDLAREIVSQSPSGESLGKPCQGVLLALRVVGLERWTASVDSIQALALVHGLNTLADRSAQLHGGALEHIQGETLLLAWSRADAAAVDAALATAQELLTELPELLQRNESQRYPLGLRAAVEAGAFLLAVAGARASRRALLLGPAADLAYAMLALSDELAVSLLVGAQAAQLRPGEPLVCLGQFLLPDQREPAPLYQVAV